MVVNTNVQALNAHRSLSIVASRAAGASEKLASGLAINRAGDDAAGLAISEKMRSQIRGLGRASTNAQDGISAIQTAEGALQETHEMLQRLIVLTTQAANDVLTTADRAHIQVEISNLLEEIDIIATRTHFNTRNLLNGNYAGTRCLNAGLVTSGGLWLQIGAQGGEGIRVSFDDMRLNFLFGSRNTGFHTAGVNAARLGQTSPNAPLQVFNSLTDLYNVGTQQRLVAALNLLGVMAPDDEFGAAIVTGRSGLSISPQIDILRGAIDLVSTQRANLGAVQNRLEHTIRNLDIAVENLSAAESRIRDTDMAAQMMEFTQGNVLTQAAQTMLAHANMAPQQVLQLLG